MFTYKITRNITIKSILVNQYPSVVLKYKGEDIYNFSIFSQTSLQKNMQHIGKFKEYLENITDRYFNSNFELVDYDITYEKACRVGLKYQKEVLNKTKRSLQYYDGHTIMNIVVGGNYPKIRPEDIFTFIFEVSEEVKTHFDLMKMMEG